MIRGDPQSGHASGRRIDVGDICVPTRTTNAKSSRAILRILSLLGFAESCGQVAQLVEHVTENHGVAGSIPALAISFDSPTFGKP